MPKIFISYRRDDSEFPAHSIYQKLAARFGREDVFIDVDAIPPGVDFRRHLNDAVGQCDALLAIIGKHWLDASNSDGSRRLDDPEDFVRIEIRAALARGIVVVPVLLGAEMPAESALPDELAGLASRNAVPVQAGRDFDSHLDRLVASLEHLLDTPSQQRRPTGSGRTFRVDGLLGRGGMGEVWLAHDEVLNRPIAIKRIRQELLDDDRAYRRFMQEARDCAKLNHPNIVRILTIDSDERGPFLVLELLEGGTLRQRLEHGKLELVEALACLRQLLQALAYAHSEGIIHRDIKPENILLTKAGVPKLADFGLAWLLRDEPSDEGRDPRRANEGTAGYTAPELRSSNELPSARTDIYSLGRTLFEMLTALPPDKIREKKVPSSVVPILRRMIFVNPNLRYASADEALHDVIELERSIELAGRTRDETLFRVDKTVQQGFQLIESGKKVDAQACFERVLAELPDHQDAQTGLLLLGLVDGQVGEAQQRFEALERAGVSNAVFTGLREFFRAIPRPTRLFATPQVMPFSYLVEDLRRGRFTKELTSFDNKSINLGDVGELLVELFQQKEMEGATLSYSEIGPQMHVVDFQFGQLSVRLDYRFHSSGGGLFVPPKLNAIGLLLTIDGAPMDIYRMARYIAHNLHKRFRRDELIDARLAQLFQVDPQVGAREWGQLLCRFEKFANRARD